MLQLSDNTLRALLDQIDKLYQTLKAAISSIPWSGRMRSLQAYSTCSYLVFDRKFKMLLQQLNRISSSVYSAMQGASSGTIRKTSIFLKNGRASVLTCFKGQVPKADSVAETELDNQDLDLEEEDVKQLCSMVHWGYFDAPCATPSPTGMKKVESQQHLQVARPIARPVRPTVTTALEGVEEELRLDV